MYNCLVPDEMINKSASTVISESPKEIRTLTITVQSISLPHKGPLGLSSAFSRWGLPEIYCLSIWFIFGFLRSKIARQRVTNLLVKASNNIICDPCQASNCVEKGEDKTDNPKIGVPALIFTLWLVEASFWNPSRLSGAVSGEDISFHCSKEKRAIRVLFYLQAVTRTTLNEMRDYNHLILSMEIEHDWPGGRLDHGGLHFHSNKHIPLLLD